MYSQTVIEHFRNPRNVGALPCPDLVGTVGRPGEGQYVVLHLNVRDGVVPQAAFRTFGCGPAIAACSLLTEWVTGRRVEEARALTPEQLIDLLGGLPEGKLYCAGLAVEALRSAVGD